MSKTKNCTKALAAVSAAAVAVSSMGFAASADSISSSKILSSGAQAIEDILENGTGYNGKLTVSFSDTLGVDIKDIAASFDASVDGSLIGLNGTLNYGDGTLGSVEAVADRDTNRIYLRIPELSDDYLYVNIDDIDLDDEDFDFDIDEDDDTVSEINSEIDWSDLDIDSLAALNPLTTIQGAQKGLSALGGYVNSAAALLGQPTATSAVTGSIQDTDYTYTAVTYKLNYTQMSQLASALSAAAKDDENVAALADLFGYDSEESGGDTVSAMINGFVFENLDDDTAKTATYTVDLYMSGTDLKGISFDNTAVSKSIVTVSDGSSGAFETSKSYIEEDEEFYEYSSLAVTVGEDGSFSGKEESTDSYKDINTGESYEDSTVMTFDNVIFSEDNVKGTIKTESYEDGELSSSNEITLDITNDKQSAVFASYSDGALVFKVTYEGEKTDGKSVSLPEGTMYNALDENELNEYLANAKLDEFMANAKDVLGDDLYELLFGGESGSDGAENTEQPDSSSVTDLGLTLSSSDTDSSDSANSSSASPSVSAASNTSSVSSNSDVSPNTGSAAAAGMALVILAAGAVVANKRK